MKIALYIEDGLEQIVLTPNGRPEVDLLNNLHSNGRRIELRKGRFYECRGGYVMQGQEPDSTFLVLRPAESENRPVTEAELDVIEAAQEWDDAQREAQFSPMLQARYHEALREAVSRLQADNDGRWSRP